MDTALFHPGWRGDAGTRALRRTLAPDGEVLLGYVGRLAPEKELHRLAEAAQVPRTRLVLVGDGPSRGDAGALLTAAVGDAPGRPNRPPVFLGRRDGDDLARAYAALDVFVHPGTRETFGQTLQEAAATGLPVLAPARGGPLDLVEHGVSGFLFDPARPGDLGTWAAALATRPRLRAELGGAGLARVAGRSWAAVVEQLLAHYGAVAREGSTRAA